MVNGMGTVRQVEQLCSAMVSVAAPGNGTEWQEMAGGARVAQ